MISKLQKPHGIFLILLSGALLVRLYGFNNPVADWHSWRQADTSAVSRNFVKFGFDILHPRFDDLSKIPSGIDNPLGYRFVEFPIYNLFQAGGFVVFDIFTLEQWGRLVTIISSLTSILFLYLIVKKYAHTTAAFFTAFFYAFLPYNIYFGRVILPDPMMVTMTLGGIYFFDRWVEEISNIKNQKSKTQIKNKKYPFYGLAILFSGAALLLKPLAIFFMLPMIVLAWNAWGVRMVREWKLWIFAVLALLPLVLWRLWMLQYPEGIPEGLLLFNRGNIRFKGAFFYWIFADRIGRLILGYYGVAIFAVGMLFIKNAKELFSFKKGYFLLFASFLVSALVYLSVIARGNVQHDYYQVLIMPSIVIFLGLGAQVLVNPPKQMLSRYVSIPLFIIVTIFSFAFSWYIVRDYFNVNNYSIVKAGKAADAILPKDAKVIAPYGGDTAFLYQTNRQGWPVIDRPIEEMIEMGAEYLVIANPTENDYSGFGQQFQFVASAPEYLILKLQ